MIEDKLRATERIRLESVAQAVAIQGMSYGQQSQTATIEAVLDNAQKIEAYIIEGKNN